VKTRSLALGFGVALGSTLACSTPTRAVVPRCGDGFARACDARQEAEYGKLVAEPINVHREWRLGNAEWSETLVDFSDRAYNEVQRKACGAEFRDELTGDCNYRVSLVVEGGRAEQVGRVMFALAGDLEGAREPICVEYSDCIAAGYVDKSIRLPSGAEGLVSLGFFVQALLPSASERDRQLPALRRDVEITREQLERLHERDWQSDPRLRFVVPHLESEVRYFERKIAEAELE
jgi:hypothetical protein